MNFDCAAIEGEQFLLENNNICAEAGKREIGVGGVIFGRALRPVQTGPGYLPDYDDDDDDAVNDIALSEATSSHPTPPSTCTPAHLVPLLLLLLL